MRDTAGKKGPSVKPTRKRQSMNDHAEVMKIMQSVTRDQPSIQIGRRILGLPFAMITFAGICEMM